MIYKLHLGRRRQRMYSYYMKDLQPIHYSQETDIVKTREVG